MSEPVKARRIRPWREWTIRTRLVVAIVGLATVALVVANVAGVFLLRNYLVTRIDEQLAAQSHFMTRSGGFDDAQLRPRPGLGPEFRVFVVGPDGKIFGLNTFQNADGTTTTLDLGPGPDFGSAAGLLGSHQPGKAFTVPGKSGAPWRAMLTPIGDTGFTAIGTLSLQDVVGTEHSLLAIDAAVSALVLLLIGIAAATVVRLGLRPLTEMETTATEIAGTDDLSRRVDDANPHTESGRLGTALNAMLVRIEAALADQKASEQRLRQFLADASHELRTPLTSIQGFAELYRRGGTPPGPELDEAMGRIESETVRMRSLVTDLLQLARLDEEPALRQEPVDLLGVVAETVRDAHVRVPTRFVQLAALDDAFDTFQPVTVLGDADKLRQVATNLIGNALQHTSDNTRIVVRVGYRGGEGAKALSADTGTYPALTHAHVTASGVPLPDGVPVAVLEVADSGPGMSQADADRVFERLFRAERSRDRRQGGAGLGLAIVAAIVSAHGGRVELTTAPGAGCRFRVLLPAEPEPEYLDDDSELAPSEPDVRVEPSA